MNSKELLNKLGIDLDIFVSIDDLYIKYDSFKVMTYDNILYVSIFMNVNYDNRIPIEFISAIHDVIRLINEVREHDATLTFSRKIIHLNIPITTEELSCIPSENWSLGFKVFKYIN